MKTLILIAIALITLPVGILKTWGRIESSLKELR